MNKVKMGFFSFVELPDPAAYLAWHQTNHMPEQLAIPGLSWGQRFLATDACRRASAARVGELGDATHLQYYLMDDPERALARFVALDGELTGLGRMRTDRVPRLQSAFQLIETQVASRVHLSSEAVPYRPNLGVYAIVEQIVDRAALDEWVYDQHETSDRELLEVLGVVGFWSFASDLSFGDAAAYGIPRSDFRITMIYLDHDPVDIARAFQPLLEARWRDAPVQAVLAAPFVSLARPVPEWGTDDL